MKWTISERIVATLAYADIFDYPLTTSEVKDWLFFVHNLSEKGLEKTLLKLVKSREIKQEQYWFLKGRRGIVETRMSREKYAEKKMAVARNVARWLSVIPSLEAVFVTGSLAVKNTPENDDIDFLCVTSAGTLWMTRFFCTLVTQVLGVRRSVNVGSVSDKICLNMFMSCDCLGLPEKEKDVYAAHELLQMQVLFDRGGVWRELLIENKWVKEIFPNKYTDCWIRTGQVKGDSNNTHSWIVRIMSGCEEFFRRAQLMYMSKRRTNEVVTEKFVRFHPRDARIWVMEAWKKKLVKYNIPLDSEFFNT